MRKVIDFKGLVQGVGFRPFLYRVCKDFGIRGCIQNTSFGARLDADIPEGTFSLFMKQVYLKKPPLSSIEKVDVKDRPTCGHKSLKVIDSESNLSRSTLVLPDIAVCPDCLRELFDSRDRRYHYPFINCTNCGPRFTIIKKIPYDRANTTMSSFQMCDECRKEYEDVNNRRFHAQPDACEKCGPKVFLKSGIEKADSGNCNPIEYSATLIKKGYVCGLKSLGGFQVAGRADLAEVIKKIRNRKNRINKPFALMAKDIESIKKFCIVRRKEEKLLNSYQAPIVILKKKEDALLPEEVAPGQKTLGFMLPFTPLHHILFSYIDKPLIMTSGNVSDEALSYKDSEAEEKLKGIVDFFLTHDREIHMRCDDSVSRVVSIGKKGATEFLLRRARGYTPLSFFVKRPFHRNILALGAQMKNTVSLTQGNNLILSNYIGDLQYLSCQTFFKDTISHFKKIFNVNPETVCCDMHPEYYSSRVAEKVSKEHGLPLVRVQHHHAHIASCMAEHNLNEKVLGVSLDGTGFGVDGAVWGGEIILANRQDFQRVGHFDYSFLPGGDTAIQQPWKMGVSLLYKVYGKEALNIIKENSLFPELDSEKISFVLQSIEKRINCIATSSTGRLFAGVSSILGLCINSSYDAEAEMLLENIADDNTTEKYDFRYYKEGGLFVIDYNKVLEQIIVDLKQGVEKGIMSAKFHHGITAVISNVLLDLKNIYAVNKVCLSGGVFQNVFLLEKFYQKLEGEGFKVFVNEKIPVNDSGISCGQAAVAAARLKDKG